MGDPKKNRKKYQKPGHPWQKQRLEEESRYIKEYGLKNKKEIWKAQSKLRHYGEQAKQIVRLTGEQADNEAEQLISNLQNLGILAQNATLNDVLTLTSKDLLERRLQTMLVKKGLARTLSQARQFVVHGHVCVGTRKVTVPSYLVKISEEDEIGFAQNSSLVDLEHPERNIATKDTETKKGKTEGSSKEEEKEE